MQRSARIFLIVPAVNFVLAFLVCTGVNAGDWPHWRGPNRNGISAESGWTDQWPEGGPQIAWRTNVGTGYSSVVVREGRLYTMGNGDDADTVYCLDAATGTKIWSYSYPAPLDPKFFEGGPTATPTTHEDALYTLSRRGKLFCFEAGTGKVRWQIDLPRKIGVRVPAWGFAGSPLVHEGLLVVSVGESGTALNPKTGEVVWTSANKDAGYATPFPLTLDGKSRLLIPSGKFYHLVDFKTGKEIWRHRWLTRFGVNAADPIVTGETAFVSSGYNRGAALLKLPGEEPEVVWSNKEMQSQMNAGVLIDGHVYGIDGDTTSHRYLKCLELKTGKVKWSHEGVGSGALTAAGDDERGFRLIVLSEDGELIVAPTSPEAFKPTARAKVLEGPCWTVPVLSGGRIYGRNAAGDLVCVDVGER